MKKPDLKGWLARIGSSFRTRAFRAGGYSAAATAVVLAIVIGVNMIVRALPADLTQFDTSANHLFTLSEQTEQLVSGLKQDVTVYWIVQAGAEDEMISTFLSRYQALSGHIKLEKKDPDLYPTFAQNYTSGQVYNNSLVVVCGERYRYVDYYDIFTYDFYTYLMTGTMSYFFEGENALTGAIDYVVNPDLPKVYLLTGHGEASLTASFKTAMTDQNIETAELSLLAMETVPEDADMVLINTPKSDISQEELDILLAYLKSGGNLFLMTEPIREERFSNLDKLMAEYGVTATDGIVVEGSQNNFYRGTPYYLLPERNAHAITTPLINSGYYVLLPIAHGLTVSEELRDTLEVSELLTTSDKAFSKLAGYNLDTYEKVEGDIDGPFSLGVAITDTVDDENETNIVWISSAYLTDENANTTVSGGNLDLFLNAVSWMCGQEERITIHAKSLDTEYLTIPSGTNTALTLLLIGVIPLAYLSVGIVIWARRKRR